MEDNLDRIGIKISSDVNTVYEGMTGLQSIINVTGFSSFERLLHVIILLKHVIMNKTFRDITAEVNASKNTYIETGKSSIED